MFVFVLLECLGVYGIAAKNNKEKRSLHTVFHFWFHFFRLQLLKNDYSSMFSWFCFGLKEIKKTKFVKKGLFYSNLKSKLSDTNSTT